MDTLNSIKSKLKPLGLYNLNDTTIINAELSAYAVGLDILNDQFDQIEKECFICTSISYGLDLREKLFGYLKSSLPNEKRRERLLYRKKITSNDYTKLKIEEAAKSCGLEGYIIEKNGTMDFDFNCTNSFLSEQEKQSVLNESKEFLPAHLACSFDFRNLSWDAISKLDKTFNEMDQKDLTWNQIDI